MENVCLDEPYSVSVVHAADAAGYPAWWPINDEDFHEKLGCQKRRYYTFAHRRLWCMYLAGCQSIHVRAIMKNKVFDAFARKADGLGRSLTKMRNAATHQPSATHYFLKLLHDKKVHEDSCVFVCVRRVSAFCVVACCVVFVGFSAFSIEIRCVSSLVCYILQ